MAHAPEDLHRSIDPPRDGDHKARRVGVAVALALLVVGGVVAAIGFLVPLPVSLTVPEAKAAFRATWPHFAQAYAAEDLAALRPYATADMVQAITGWYGCGCGTWPPTYTALRLSVPPQNRYPLEFLAEVPGVEDGGVIGRELVFTKDSASSPWLVADMVAFVGVRNYLAQSTASPSPGAPYPITRVPGQFARFFQSWVNTGAPPAGDVWPDNGSVKDEVDRYLGIKQDIEAIGLAQHTVFTPDLHTIAFATPGGSIMCGDLTSRTSVTSPTGAPIVQPPDQSGWGTHLVPGSYTTLTKVGTHDFCFTVTTHGLTTPISFLGGTYTIVGHH